MGKLKPSPDLYKRAKGYGVLNALHERQAMEDNPVWKPVPAFPEYEVNELRQVRRVTTKAPIMPYSNRMMPHEGEYVDFWVNGHHHAVPLNTIMGVAFPKGTES